MIEGGSRYRFDTILGGLLKAVGVKSFHTEELAPTRRPHPPIQLWSAIIPTAWVCQRLRDASGGPVHINSGYRTPQYNSEVGGAINSQHIYFTALDIVSVEWTPDQVFGWLDAQPFRAQIALGRYPTFTHIDSRHWPGNPLAGMPPARWDNR